MNCRQALIAALTLAAELGTAVAHPASTLSYTRPQTGTAQHLSLRRSGAWLQIVDDGSGRIVASARAAETQRVAIRGADRDDDALTIDLSQRFVLPGGVDYDGGADGWDTLEIVGGNLERETITQLTPHDGVIDADGLVIRYVNLEPIVDIVPAATLTVNGTAGADSVMISDGPVAGQATISSPTFESITFANKTNVIFDGMGGGDSVVFANPHPPAGLSRLIVRGVASIAQTAPVTYAALGISASGHVYLADGKNDVANIEIVTQSGDIEYDASGDVTVGGVSADLSGMRVLDSGEVFIISGGKLTLADTDGADIVSAGATLGNVYLSSALDVIVPVDNVAVTARAGSIDILSGRDLLLGTQGVDFRNDVRSSASRLSAQRDLVVAGHSSVVGVNYAQLGAGHDVTVADGATLSATDTLGQVAIYAENGNLNLDGGGAAAATAAMFVVLASDHVSIGPASGVAAGNLVQITTKNVGIDIGASGDTVNAMAFSSAEATRITAPNVDLDAGGGAITVSQAISVPYELDLFSSVFTATGAGSLSAPALGFGARDQAFRQWTADESGITISPGARIPYSGATKLILYGGDGDDTFDVTPAATMAIQVWGAGPNPPSNPGDTLRLNLAGADGSLYATTSPGGYTGDYFFSNRASVHFDLIETLEPSADLGVTITDGVRSALPGTTLVYTIVASNSGLDGVTGATVYDTFDAAFGNVRWTCSATAGSSCKPAGSGSLLEYVDLAAGGSATFAVTVDVDPAAADSVTNTVSIVPPAVIFDPNTSNDSATDTDVIGALADLKVAATSTQTSYQPGGSIAYTLVLGNAGPDAASNVTLLDTLPPGTTFGSLTVPAGFSCSTPAAGSKGTISCSASSLGVSTNTFDLRVNVDSATSAPIINSATVSGASVDPNGANNASAVSVVAAAAPVAATPMLSPFVLLLLLLTFTLMALLRLRRVR